MNLSISVGGMNNQYQWKKDNVIIPGATDSEYTIDPVELYGENNVKLNLLRKAFPEITITSRGNNVKLAGDKKFTQKAKSKFELMVRLLKEHEELPVQMVEDLMNGSNPFENRLSNGNAKTILHGRGGKQIKAKTRNQKKLIEASESNDIVFANHNFLT